MSEELPDEVYNDDDALDPKELFEHYRFTADPKQSPVRIDKFLLDRLERVSRSRIQGAIRAGMIRVNGHNTKPNYRIRPGDLVTIALAKPPYENTHVIPEEMPLDIRYEDDDLMIVHKPPGLVVHPGVGVYSGTLVNGLAHYFQQLNLPVKEGNFSDRPGLVHRIDKDTSGLLVIAKTESAMTHLSRQFYDHITERRYLALIWGEPKEDEGTIIGHIGRDPKYPMLRKVFPEGDQGKYAVTHYKVIERLYYVSLVECRLETGRTHQIRIHFKWQGHPLFSDYRYGGDRIMKGTVFSKYRQFVENCFKMMPRQALHARSLGFIHPRTGEKVHFDSELPEDFQAVLDKWRSYVSTRKTIIEQEVDQEDD